MTFRSLSLFFVLVAILFLISCTRCGPVQLFRCNPCIIGYPVPPVCLTPETCTVELCKEPIVCTIEDKNRTIAYLINRGVKVIHVGETITLVFQSDRVFNGSSGNLNSAYLPVLQAASHLIFCYEKMSVRIAAHTDNRCASRVNDLVTRAQSQSIAKFLWCHGIDTRLLFAIGYGDRFPIASNCTSSGRAQNRRIEICFRYIPPYVTSCGNT